MPRSLDAASTPGHERWPYFDTSTRDEALAAAARATQSSEGDVSPPASAASPSAATKPRFEVGDVVVGRFSAIPIRRERAIVRGIVADQFHGDCIDYAPGYGYGTWGFEGQVEEVLRRATETDERAAADVKAKVEAETERFLRRGR